MCGRFVSVSSPQLLVDRFGVEETTIEAREPDYNVTPRAMVPIVRDRPPRKGADGPDQAGADDGALGARAVVGREHRHRRQADQRPGRDHHREGRVQARLPRAAAASSRPTRSTSGVRRSSTSTKRPPRQPFLVHRRDGEPLAFAGLWEIWRDETVADPDAPDAWVRSCAIVTTRANDVARARSTTACRCARRARLGRPGSIPPTDDLGALEAMLRPAPDDWLEVYPVSTRVNSPDNNDADLIQRVPSRTRSSEFAAIRRSLRAMETEQYLEQLDAQTPTASPTPRPRRGRGARRCRPVPGGPSPTCSTTASAATTGRARSSSTGSRASPTGCRPSRPPTSPTATRWSRTSATGAQALVATLRRCRPRHVGVDVLVGRPHRARSGTAGGRRRPSVHRYDAETAAGTPTPSTPTLAVDGIDEFLTVFLPRLAGQLRRRRRRHRPPALHRRRGRVAPRPAATARRRRDRASTPRATSPRGAPRPTSLLFLWGRVPADDGSRCSATPRCSRASAHAITV